MSHRRHPAAHSGVVCVLPVCLPCCCHLLPSGALFALLSWSVNLDHYSNALTVWLGMHPTFLFFQIFLPPMLLDSAVRIDFFLFKKVTQPVSPPARLAACSATGNSQMTISCQLPAGDLVTAQSGNCLLRARGWSTCPVQWTDVYAAVRAHRVTAAAPTPVRALVMPHMSPLPIPCAMTSQRCQLPALTGKMGGVLVFCCSLWRTACCLLW